MSLPPEVRNVFVSGAPVHLRVLGLLPDPVASVRVILHDDLRVEAFVEPRGPEPPVDKRRGFYFGESMDDRQRAAVGGARCIGCGAPALDGHLTCGDVRCDEGGARREAFGDWLRTRESA